MSYPIIQIRGTSGSGKSTLMRAAIEAFLGARGYKGKVPLEKSPPAQWHIQKRKQPVAYLLHRAERVPDAPESNAVVLGHYETACGGCDTLPSYECIRDMALYYSDHAPVLLEGLLMSGDLKFTAMMAAEREYHVVFLDTPIDTCLAQIGQRREARGDERPIKPDNTVAKDKLCRKLKERIPREYPHIKTFAGSYDEALAYVLSVLGVQGSHA